MIQLARKKFLIANLKKGVKMNNKRGGVGAKLLLVLILMIASAAGGAYGYSVLDGKMAVRDAKKAVEDVDISDYDTPEQTIIQGYIDDASKDLSTAKTRKQVYEIIGDFISDVEKVKTKTQKELEAALKAAEEAKKNNQGNDDDSGSATDNNADTDKDDQGSYKNNTLDIGEDENEDGGFLNSLIGGMKSGAKKE